MSDAELSDQIRHHFVLPRFAQSFHIVCTICLLPSAPRQQQPEPVLRLPALISHSNSPQAQGTVILTVSICQRRG